ncbi:MAG: dodecin domain-containing protein [Prochloraceae cyanobacterium]|nr:dodecin domain-containing protein [Prochloraceae cyanobacterium]
MIRVIASSKKSFDDAVKEAIEELKKGGKHDDLEFTDYQVVQLQGTIEDRGKECNPDFYRVVLDVAGTHIHDKK